MGVRRKRLVGLVLLLGLLSAACQPCDETAVTDVEIGAAGEVIPLFVGLRDEVIEGEPLEHVRRTEDCSPNDPLVCYRLGDGFEVERSDDGGESYSAAYRLRPGRVWRMNAMRPSCAVGEVALHDLAVANDGTVYVAAGGYGVLQGSTSGHFAQTDVLHGAPAPFHNRTLIDSLLGLLSLFYLAVATVVTIAVVQSVDARMRQAIYRWKLGLATKFSLASAWIAAVGYLLLGIAVFEESVVALTALWMAASIGPLLVVLWIRMSSVPDVSAAVARPRAWLGYGLQIVVVAVVALLAWLSVDFSLYAAIALIVVIVGLWGFLAIGTRTIVAVARVATDEDRALSVAPPHSRTVLIWGFAALAAPAAYYAFPWALSGSAGALAAVWVVTVAGALMMMLWLAARTGVPFGQTFAALGMLLNPLAGGFAVANLVGSSHQDGYASRDRLARIVAVFGLVPILGFALPLFVTFLPAVGDALAKRREEARAESVLSDS